MRTSFVPILAMMVNYSASTSICTESDGKVMQDASESSNIQECIGNTPSRIPECFGGSKLSSGCLNCLNGVLQSTQCKNVVCGPDTIETCLQCMIGAMTSCAPAEPDVTTKDVGHTGLLFGMIVSLALALI
jgi:hypothetical protein